MQDQIDDSSYTEGKAAFASGATLRSILERCAAAKTDAEEIKAFSFAFGFAEGLLDNLRHPIFVTNASAPQE